MYQAIKRGMDILLAATGLLLFSPLLAMIAIAVRMTLGNPILFRQPRPGLDARPFTLLKFRTMKSDDEARGILLTDATRLTRFGLFLRRLSLDELPALWNVLQGDLSMVGPRPLLMQYLARYSPAQARRHAVKPGITGWAQINGRNALSWEQKFELDLWYVRHRSLLLDARILLGTVRHVFSGDGISQDGHATMPEFQATAQSSR